MTIKYNNKFEEILFKPKDIISSMDDDLYHVTTLNKDLDHLKINDDFSNEEQVKDQHTIQTQNSKNILIDALGKTEKGHETLKNLNNRNDSVNVNSLPLMNK
ncbi:hypothetical protein GCM10008908_05240 [Clostridium subterminale]|uniref:Uncharacterized protein n=1 Tax=Clostridium subterminale TaxID=1550 RepID=A0ABN1KHD1_CLOSU